MLAGITATSWRGPRRAMLTRSSLTVRVTSSSASSDWPAAASTVACQIPAWPPGNSSAACPAGQSNAIGSTPVVPISRAWKSVIFESRLPASGRKGAS